MLFPRKRLRQYQKKVVDDIRDENAIVKMPTGSGKTFVAAEFISRGLRKIKGTTNRKAALFLAPTCDLVTVRSIEQLSTQNCFLLNLRMA